MRYRVREAFVLAPGKIAQVGDVIDVERTEVRMHGIKVVTGFNVHSSLVEEIRDTPEPAEGPARESEPIQRDPAVRDRDPRPRRRRAKNGGST
jgi:hypothetical protein